MTDLQIFSISGYRATDIAKSLNVSRQAVSALAIRYKWIINGVIGREKIFRPEDVALYMDARRRTPLAERLGAKIHGLSWDESYDGACPQCGAFAVFWQADLDAYIADPDKIWICEAGHRNE